MFMLLRRFVELFGYDSCNSCTNMNSLIVSRIETAILENAEITKLFGDSKYCSRVSER